MELQQLPAWVLERALAHFRSPSVLRTHAMLAGVLLVSLLLEIASRRDWRLRYGSRSFRVDLLYYVFYYSGIYHFLVFAPLYRLLSGLVARHAPALQMNLIAELPPAAQIVTFLLVSDLLGYWIHRARHASPLLWWFHAIHHSQTRLTVVTNYRFHFVDETVQRLLLFVPFLILGTGVTVWLWADILMAWLLLIQHSEWDWSYGRLGRVFVSPVFHRKHHSTDLSLRDRNFSMLFAFWDDLFGTAERRAPPPLRYGVAGENIPESFLGQQVWPFAKVLGKVESPVTEAGAAQAAAGRLRR
jgi:sterol desaturase/sphingolipid hydroxylase (fatty acid hydroxylase superfamily)